MTPGKKYALWPRVAARVVLIALLAVLGSGCESRSGIDRSGMADPGRNDAQPVKIIVGGSHYIVPANCLISPLERGEVVGGFSVQEAILISFIIPSGECRTEQNYKKFRDHGYGDTITLLVAAYRGIAPKQALNMYLVRTIEQYHSTGRRTDLPKPFVFDSAADEQVWRTQRRVDDDFSPVMVRSDSARTYAAHCSGVPVSPRYPGSCSVVIYRDNRYLASFSPKWFGLRRFVIKLISAKLKEVEVSSERTEVGA